MAAPDAGFARDVRDALRHLGDPVYLEAHPLARFVARAPGERHVGESLQRRLRAAVEELRPPPAVDDPAARRRHEALHLRYVEQLPNAEVQARLAVSLATLYRELDRALDALVSRLWTEWHQTPRRPAPPVLRTALIGRETEAAAARALLGTAAVLTLTGPGGVGKTRLALQVAADAADSFPDGVFFVPLAGISDPALVGPTVAEALSVPADGLAARLSGKRLLLVLDNVEHVLEAGADVAAAAAAHPGVRVIATSRAPLRVYGEQELPLRPLSLPPPQAGLDRAAAAASHAVQLFVDRARSVDPSFALDDDNAAAVVEICRRVDGLPLAVELAAARLRVMPPAALAARLEPLLPLLAGGPRDAPARQRAMRATIGWSYDLLDEPLRRLFRQLSVFAGGFTLDAAERVCGRGPEGALDVLAGVEALIAQSLLHREDGRIAMLSTVREWGLERLAERADEAAATRTRHAAYYARLAEEAVGARAGGVGLARLGPERDNLRAALRFYLDRRAAEAAHRLGAALAELWYRSGRLAEGRAWLGEVLRLGEGAPPSARAETLAAASRLALLDADPTEASDRAAELLSLGRALGDERAVAEGLGALGTAEGWRGRTEVAEPLLTEALALHERLSDARGVAADRQGLGVCALKRGDLAAARSALEGALAAAEQAGDDELAAVAGEWLGNVALAGGRLAAARAHYERASRRAADDPWLVVHCVQALALAALAEGDVAGAAARLAECLPRQRDLRDRAWLPASLEAAAACVARRAAGGNGAGASRAFELAAAAAALRGTLGEVPVPDAAGLQSRLAGWLDDARTLVTPTELAAATARGRALPIDGAVGLALTALAEAG